MSSGEIEGFKPSKKFLIVHEHWQLLMELCHFTEKLNPLWSTSLMQQQLRGLSYDVINETAGLKSDQEKLQHLIRYFFDQMKFQIVPAESLQLTDCFLPEVLRRQRGPVTLLMLLMTTLLEECQIKVQISSAKRRYLLKVEIANCSMILDFTDRCRSLDASEIVDLINMDFDFSHGSVKKNNLIIDYLGLIQELARNEQKLHILSLTHSYLMRYQPFNLKHLTNRAVTAYETGDYRRAIEDIRSYFQYKQPEFTNAHLKKIYKLAIRKEHLKRDN